MQSELCLAVLQYMEYSDNIKIIVQQQTYDRFLIPVFQSIQAPSVDMFSRRTAGLPLM